MKVALGAMARLGISTDGANMAQNTVTVMGYNLGTCESWDGDIEYLLFGDYIPAPQIENWPKEANSIHIDTVKGTVKAYGDEEDHLAEWPWKDFIKNY